MRLVDHENESLSTGMRHLEKILQCTIFINSLLGIDLLATSSRWNGLFSSESEAYDKRLTSSPLAVGSYKIRKESWITITSQ